MLHNAKCLVKYMIAKTQYNQVINLINMQSIRPFIQETRRTKKLLLKCPNQYYVSEQDKKQLAGHDSILDRSHLTYLINNDPELLEFQKPEEGRCAIYINVIEYSFGLLHRTIDQVITFDRQIKEFLALKVPAIFVIFVGVVNHWVTFIAQKKGKRALPDFSQVNYKKGKKNDHKFYLLDSSNFVHLDKTELELPELVMERVREKVQLGLKASSMFQVKMTIQSMYDQRAIFAKLV